MQNIQAVEPDVWSREIFSCGDIEKATFIPTNQSPEELKANIRKEIIGIKPETSTEILETKEKKKPCITNANQYYSKRKNQ